MENMSKELIKAHEADRANRKTKKAEKAKKSKPAEETTSTAIEIEDETWKFYQFKQKCIFFQRFKSCKTVYCWYEDAGPT